MRHSTSRLVAGSALAPLFASLSLLLVLEALAPPALAAPPGEVAAAPAAAPPPPGKWPGFRIQLPELSSELRVRGLLQCDALFFVKDDRDQNDRFEIRRVRLTLDGKIGERVAFRLQPQWSPGSVVLLDAYADVGIVGDALVLRAGKQKTPLGIEMLQAASATILPERGLASALVPNRDIGVQLFGEVAGGVLSYAVGVGTGAADQGRPEGNIDDHFDVYGRVFVQPFRGGQLGALRDLGVGVAGSWGKETGGTSDSGLGRYRTGARDTIAQFAEGVVADGTRWRLNPQLWWYAGAFGLLADYVYSEQEVRGETETRAVGNHAWTAGATYVLTQEKASYKGVSPARRWGALELALRYGELHVDRDAIDAGLLRTGAPSVARSWGASLNYYLHAAVRAQLAFEQTRYDVPAGGDRAPENALTLRLQVSP
jgi:phosphate-selective porin OprO/OprP